MKTELAEFVRAVNREVQEKDTRTEKDGHYIHPDMHYMADMFSSQKNYFTFYFDQNGTIKSFIRGYTHAKIMGMSKSIDPTLGLGRLAKLNDKTYVSVWEPGRQLLTSGDSVWITDKLPILKKVLTQLEQLTKDKPEFQVTPETIVPLSHNRSLTVADIMHMEQEEREKGLSMKAAQHIVPGLKPDAPGFGSQKKRMQGTYGGGRGVWGDSVDHKNINTYDQTLFEDYKMHGELRRLVESVNEEINEKLLQDLGAEGDKSGNDKDKKKKEKPHKSSEKDLGSKAHYKFGTSTYEKRKASIKSRIGRENKEELDKPKDKVESQEEIKAAITRHQNRLATRKSGDKEIDVIKATIDALKRRLD